MRIFFIIAFVTFQINFLSAQKISVPEPEFINSVVYVKMNKNNTIKLEKAIPSNMAKSSPISMLGNGFGQDSFLRIEGKASPVKISVESNYLFIVKMASNELDPADEIAIIRMKVKRKHRQIKISEEKIFGGQSYNELDYIPYSAKKFGDSSYLLTVNQTLEPGEYAIMLRNVSDVLNAFGVKN